MFSTSSSLAVSGNHHELPRHKGTGFVKNGLYRSSKQHQVEKKMFGSKSSKGKHGKDTHIGRKFRDNSSSKHGEYRDHDGGERMNHSIGPSVEESDSWMKKGKKSSHSRKMYG